MGSHNFPPNAEVSREHKPDENRMTDLGNYVTPAHTVEKATSNFGNRESTPDSSKNTLSVSHSVNDVDGKESFSTLHFDVNDKFTGILSDQKSEFTPKIMVMTEETLYSLNDEDLAKTINTALSEALKGQFTGEEAVKLRNAQNLLRNSLEDDRQLSDIETQNITKAFDMLKKEGQRGL